MVPATHTIPFKGLDSYDESDSTMFYGRDEEIEKLCRLIRLNVLTLVYGKSGMGKSSLLKAGCKPVLRQQNYFPVWIRYPFNTDPSASINASDIYRRIVKEYIEKEAEANNISIEINGEMQSETLWEYFQRASFWNSKNMPQIPVLIFDQFEELYKIGKGSSEATFLVEQLCDLIEDYMPAVFEGNREVLKDLDTHQSFFKVVFSFREDDLVMMEQTLKSISMLSNSRFYLGPMSASGAKDVVDKPVPGLFDENGVDKIIAYVSAISNESGFFYNLKNGIEPVILSLVCTGLYNKVKGQENPRVTNDLLQFEKFHKIIDSFYEETLKDKHPSVHIYIEDELIDGYGNRQLKPYEDEDFLHLKVHIDDLIDKKLLRKVEYAKVVYVEVIHDLLMPIIRHNRKMRRRREKAKRDQVKMLKMAMLTIALIAVVMLPLYYALEVNKKPLIVETKALNVEQEEQNDANSNFPMAIQPVTGIQPLKQAPDQIIFHSNANVDAQLKAITDSLQELENIISQLREKETHLRQQSSFEQVK
jgi:hypothetical protein